MIDESAGRQACIRRGMTFAADPAEAARELHRLLAGPDVALVLFFCSPEYEAPGFVAEIERLFAGILVVGCTSAGEIGPGGYHEHSITGVSFARRPSRSRLGPAFMHSASAA